MNGNYFWLKNDVFFFFRFGLFIYTFSFFFLVKQTGLCGFLGNICFRWPPEALRLLISSDVGLS